METLIVYPKNIEQLNAVKAFLKALHIPFKTSKESSTQKSDFTTLTGKLEWDKDKLAKQKN
jgi:hypothetical protein